MLCGGSLARYARKIVPHIWRVRVRLTLMLAGAANAAPTPAPARHLGLVRTSRSACLSLPRARGERRRLSNGFRAIHAPSYVTILARGQAGKLVASRLDKEKQSSRRHRADTCTPLSRQASARFRPRPMTDSPFFARSIRCRTPLHRLRGMLSLIPTVANQRDSQKTSGASRRIQKAARLRPAKTSALRREASPVAEDKALARDAPHGQDTALVVSTASFRGAPQAALAKLADLTLKTDLV